MSEDTQTIDSVGELRRVALSRIEPRPGFNPRQSRDPERFAQLVASIKADGLLTPLLVTPHQNGGFSLVAGEGRYLACGEAGQTEVPVLVTAVDERTGGLELAMAENLARQELDPVEEAHGFHRLRDAGLTKKGIAERFGIAQKRITDRLEILKVPESLHAQIACGLIPPSAVKALVRLGNLHVGLPDVVAARVAASPAQPWMEPLTWAAVVEDPVGALIVDADGPGTALPAEVFDAAETYPVSRFTLADAVRAQLVELCGLLGLAVEEFAVRFGREAVEQAQQLGAAQASREGWHHVIVGQDVGDQLAGDYIAACLTTQRETAARVAEERSNSDADATGSEPREVGQESEEERKAQRRAEREAEQQARRAAVAHNLELGAAVLKHLARLKVDADVLKVLTAVDVAGDVDGIAARGARYGFPGWPTEVEQKNAKVKVEYLTKEQAGARARAFLAQAETVAEIAGRLFCLIAMARYADEDAVARSNRSMYWLRVPDGLPFSADVLDLIDAVCEQRLPDHLTAAVREHRGRQRAEQVEREQASAAARERLERVEERAGALSDEERDQARADIALVYGRYSTEGWQLERLLKQAATHDPPAADDPETDADQPAGDDERTGDVVSADDGDVVSADDEAVAA